MALSTCSHHPTHPQLQATLSSQTRGESRSEKNMDCSLIASGCLFVPRLWANPASCAGLRQSLWAIAMERDCLHPVMPVCAVPLVSRPLCFGGHLLDRLPPPQLISQRKSRENKQRNLWPICYRIHLRLNKIPSTTALTHFRLLTAFIN